MPGPQGEGVAGRQWLRKQGLLVAFAAIQAQKEEALAHLHEALAHRHEALAHLHEVPVLFVHVHLLSPPMELQT